MPCTAAPARTALQGNKGADWLDGGSEADVLLGGTSKAGTADGADVLFGAGGTDVLVGDNAQTDVAAQRSLPDRPRVVRRHARWQRLPRRAATTPTAPTAGSATTPSSAATATTTPRATPAPTRISGEAGDDDLVGGSSELASGLFTGTEPGRPDAGDHLFGGAGQDVITGDNAVVTRGGTAHPVMTGPRPDHAPAASTWPTRPPARPRACSATTTIQGGGDTDVVFGQRGDDDVSLGDAARLRRGRPGRRPRARGRR